MKKQNNTILWIIGVIVFLIVVTKFPLIPQFAIIEYAPDNQNLVYQVHENIKLIDDGCIIEQRNSGVHDTYLSCNTWLYREKEKGYIDFNTFETPFFWNYEGTELRWIYEMTSDSGCLFNYYRGGLWTYLVGVKLEGGKIINEISDLYTYQNYDFNLSTKMSYIDYISPDWIMEGLCPLGTYTYEEGIEIIDDCGSFDVIDPSPYNGLDELKCDAYCRAGLRECVVRSDGFNESQYCILDGSEIEHEVCYSGCENGICTPQVRIEIPSIIDYNYEDDINITVRLLIGDEVYSTSTLMVGRIEMGGASISENSNYTNENGYTTLRFENVKAAGFVSLVVSTMIRGIEYQEIKEIFFSGMPISFELTTESYTQSNAGNITFLVEVMDTNYRPISPELITDLRADTSLSEGTILGNYINYQGSGIYEVGSEVSGTGVFSGRLLFTYKEVSFESPSINIDVEYVTISVGTSLIKPMAILNTTETYTIMFASPTGELLDPDEITIKVSFPTGYEEDILTIDDLIRIDVGTYEFDYYFSEVEKYSFDIYASKEGFAGGNAKATVSVTGEEGAFGPGPAFGFENLKWVVFGIIVIIAFFLIIKRGGKK